MLDALRCALPDIEAHAAALDDAAAFPAADMQRLGALGLATAPLPAAMGGLGAGTEPAGVRAIFDLLRMLGRANLSVARLFEAHVNVVRLVIRYGAPHHIESLAQHCRAGAFHGLWVTDAPGQTLRWSHGALHGSKGPCSGAGHLRHALVTIQDNGATRMALLALSGDEPVESWSARLHGMRASANGTIGFDETPLPARAMIGDNGDYLREPDFSTGAWRTMAATLGGMDALLDTVRTQLRARGHEELPLQQARFGAMLLARETARLFTWEAASVAEAGIAPVPDQIATVNLARIAVETACLDLIRDAQRALGLSALVRPNPAERLIRDLSTYLRQPAPDLVLTEAALHHLRA
jgi:alkylation response protein AidB-like acyl-CoA dehydrogenase